MTNPAKRGPKPVLSLPKELPEVEKPRRGPKTPEGRAAVRHNALKHGMTSIQPVIEAGIEEEADWFRFRDAIIASYTPVGALEEELAGTCALTLWRKRRVAFYENAIINIQVAETESNLATADAYLDGTLGKGELPAVDPDRVAAYQHTRVIPLGDDADKIMRYETHLHRLWMQTHHELESLQARRRGEPANLHRLDITAPPSA